MAPGDFSQRSVRVGALVALGLVAAACNEGSGNAPRVTALSRATHLAFPIARGSHASTDCNDCHGAYDSFADFSCTTGGCHAEAPTGREHAGISGYAWDSQRCYACHKTGEAELDRQSHDLSFFPITASQKHAAVACGDCHTDASDRRRLTCDACHSHPAAEMPAEHAAVADFASVATDCLRCHAESQVFRVAVHGPLRVTSGAPHARVNCLKCHAGTRTDRPWAADFSMAGLSCLTGGCHARTATDAQHPGVLGYAYDSAKCASCHPDGTATFDHTAFFPITQADTHTGIACAECHQNPSNARQQTCDQCHGHPAVEMPARHAGVFNFAQVATECVRCHADSQVNRVEAHQPLRIDAGSAHAQAACFDCHPARRADKTWAADFSAPKLDCLNGGCHAKPATDAKHARVPGYAWVTASCFGCHPDGRPNVDHTPFFPIAPTDTHANIGCAECHTDPANRKQLTCDACHSHPAAQMPTAHEKVYGFGTLNAACVRCHAESQVNRVAAHLPFKIGSNTGHKRSTCFDCHPRMRTDKTWATDFSAATINCVTCHARTETDSHHRQLSGYEYLSTGCIKGGCHPDGSSHD